MRSSKLLLVAGAALLSACGRGELVVTAEVEMDNPEGEGVVPRALEGVEVQLLPFDRDAVFDSLASAAPRPEPEIPPELLASQREVAEAQQAWRDADAEWNTLRDALQSLSTELESLGRASAQYRVRFAEFNEMEGRLRSVEQQKDQAFARFTGLQSEITSELDRVRLLREAWADEAFADVGTVMDAYIREAGTDAVIDTTDANGVVRLLAPSGTWWVHARYPLLFEELYWNEQVELQGGEPMPFTLTRSNAEPRPIL